jgi:hypothetical protein
VRSSAAYSAFPGRGPYMSAGMGRTRSPRQRVTADSIDGAPWPMLRLHPRLQGLRSCLPRNGGTLSGGAARQTGLAPQAS